MVEYAGLGEAALGEMRYLLALEQTYPPRPIRRAHAREIVLADEDMRIPLVGPGKFNLVRALTTVTTRDEWDDADFKIYGDLKRREYDIAPINNALECVFADGVEAAVLRERLAIPDLRTSSLFAAIEWDESRISELRVEHGEGVTSSVSVPLGCPGAEIVARLNAELGGARGDTVSQNAQRLTQLARKTAPLDLVDLAAMAFRWDGLERSPETREGTRKSLGAFLEARLGPIFKACF